MKKLTALCLTLTLTCSLAACSHPSSENSTFASQPNAESTAPAPERTQKPSEQPSDAPTQAPTEAPTTEPEANEGKTLDRKSTRLNSSHDRQSRMPSSA